MRQRIVNARGAGGGGQFADDDQDASGCPCAMQYRVVTSGENYGNNRYNVDQVILRITCEHWEAYTPGNWTFVEITKNTGTGFFDLFLSTEDDEQGEAGYMQWRTPINGRTCPPTSAQATWDFFINGSTVPTPPTLDLVAIV